MAGKQVCFVQIKGEGEKGRGGGGGGNIERLRHLAFLCHFKQCEVIDWMEERRNKCQNVKSEFGEKKHSFDSLSRRSENVS